MEKRDPALRRHKGKAIGYVRLNGVDHYFSGVWPEGEKVAPADIRRQYASLIAEWLAGGGKPLPKEDRRKRAARADAAAEQAPETQVAESITVAEVAALYLRHASEYYRDEDGEPTSELAVIRDSLRPLIHLFGRDAAESIDAKSLRAVQRLLVDGYVHPRIGPRPPLCRWGVNHKCNRIKRMFRWAGDEGIVSASVWHTLRCVPGLVAGRTRAKERAAVKPAPAGDVEKTLAVMTPCPAGLVRLQLATGCRPGEATRICLGEIDRSGEIWVWRPRKHKTKWRGHKRTIAVGARGQAAILERVRIECPSCGVQGRPPAIGCRDGATCGPCADRHDEGDICGPWWRAETHPPDEPLFNPASDAVERGENCGRSRRSPCRYKSATSYNSAIVRAARAAGVPAWHANQLRHSYATTARAAFGLEAAQVALGHKRADVTQIYAERDLDLATRVAREIG